ncbi:MAG: putative oxygenase MesX [Micrococcaceae bacterium]
MNDDFTLTISRIPFNEDYQPSDGTRLTTNFANLARGEHRQRNMRNTLQMINTRFNHLASWDNPHGDRYSLEIEIVSIDVDVEGQGETFPAIELLQTTIVDHHTHHRIEGVTGNSLSSYVRDYDFSVRLPAYNTDSAQREVPDDFGLLHGELFKFVLDSETYRRAFAKPPVICLSVSTSKTYRRTTNVHPILGVEYAHDDVSLTDRYFDRMGLQARYFLPPGSVAPLAFYSREGLLTDYTNLELISVISTMESFQKIYRPEIYNANSPAGAYFRPSLANPDCSFTQIDYDREERSQLARRQGLFTQEHFIEPHKPVLERWTAHRGQRIASRQG